MASADCKCLYADVKGFWNNCTLLQSIVSGSQNLPPPKLLNDGRDSIPNVTVADDAFALKSFLKKPYPQKNLDLTWKTYNFRLSRARRIVENVFGILANRWRILLSQIALEPEKIQSVVVGILTLRNWLRSEP